MAGLKQRMYRSPEGGFAAALLAGVWMPTGSLMIDGMLWNADVLASGRIMPRVMAHGMLGAMGGTAVCMGTSGFS